MVRARYWEADGARVRCRLCPNFCSVAPGKLGRCLGKKNIDGVLYATNYGQVVSIGMDPIEKKPLYHYHPGEEILSVATYGCNLLCPFCQNYEISQRIVPARQVSPERLVEEAKGCGSFGVAFTYTEPLIWFEYLMDVCPLLERAGLESVLVTNGMINPEPLEELLPHIDAMNVDLKSTRPEFYDTYVKGSLDAVIGTIKAARSRCHVEVTYLLIPGRNDTEPELRALTDFAAGLGRDTVLHISRFFPRHRATEPPTPLASLKHAVEIARGKLDYVYLGNVAPEPEYRDSHCPRCGRQLVDRAGYAGRIVGIEQGKCTGCGRRVDFVL